MPVIQHEFPVLPALSEELLVECIRGHLRLVWYGSTLPLRLKATELEEYETAKERGYCIGPTRRRNLAYAYGYWCQIRKLPRIHLRHRENIARVQMDLFAIPETLCEHQADRINEIARRLTSKKRGVCRAKAGSGYYDSGRLQVVHAKSLAAELVKIFGKPCEFCSSLDSSLELRPGASARQCLFPVEIGE